MKSANQSWPCQTAKRRGCLGELLVCSDQPSTKLERESQVTCVIHTQRQHQGLIKRFSGCGRPECRQPDRKNCTRQGLSAIAGPALQDPPGSNAPPAQSGTSPAPACCGGCGWRAAVSPHRPDPTALAGSVMACSPYLADLSMPSKNRMGRYAGGVLRPVDSGPQPLTGSAEAVGKPAATLQGAPDCVQQEQATSFCFKRLEEQAVAIRQPHALQALTTSQGTAESKSAGIRISRDRLLATGGSGAHHRDRYCGVMSRRRRRLQAPQLPEMTRLAAGG